MLQYMGVLSLFNLSKLSFPQEQKLDKKLGPGPVNCEQYCDDSRVSGLKSKRKKTIRSRGSFLITILNELLFV